MDVHGSGVSRSFMAPDFSKQSFPGMDAAGVGGERIQEVELFGGERDL